MFNDEFKSQYTTIPFAVFSREHKVDASKSNIESLFHHHKEFEILYVMEGEAIYYIDSNEYRIQKGDIVIVQPYIIHRATILADKSFSHCCLCFDLKIIYDRPLQEGFEDGTIKVTPIIKSGDPYSRELGSCILNAFYARNNRRDGWELAVIGNLSLFFSMLKEHNKIGKSQIKNKTNFCHRIIRYIDSNYNQNITSNDAARVLFMNNSYFCRKFKDNFGYCFQRYLEAYRMEKAKISLRMTLLPVSEIALSVGFNDFSYFSKVFKRREKCTPSEYRKARSQQN